MFHKPVKVKSNSAIRGSDRKRLRTELGQAYPDFPVEDLTSLVPSKDDMTVTKMQTHAGDNVLVYTSNKNPIFFEVDKVTYPTLYTLWKFPQLLHTFTTHDPVLQKLCNGADLMMPGIVVKEGSLSVTYGRLQKFDRCAINITSNKAPIAVGYTAVSSIDMIESGRRGKGVIVLHTFGDHLWAMGTKANPPPMGIAAADDESEEEEVDANNVNEGTQKNNTKQNDNVVNTGGSESKLVAEVSNLQINNAKKHPKQENAASSSGIEPADILTEKTETEIMDELLNKCFFTALKTTAKKVELPLLTSTLFRTHMVPCLPKGQFLDVKKSSYKKLTKYLQEMQAKQFIELRELAKGVESVTAINHLHPALREFKPEARVEEPEEEEKAAGENQPYQPPEIVEMHTVTAAVLPIFKESGYGKGAAFTLAGIKTCLKEYVKKNDLTSTQQKGYVVMDPILTDCLLNKGEVIGAVRWDDLISRCSVKMQPAYQVTFPGQKPVIRKGKLEPIEINVATRAGNKKVTLVVNLEVFGIDTKSFAHQVQHGVAASTSVYTAPNRKEGQEVLIQGNQVDYVGRLLADEYHINKKYIKGLELAPKKKKK